jgi:peroxiredoxin
MALVNSVDVPLGSPVIPFQLKDPSGRIYKTEDVFGAKGLLIAFTCNHCPYAIAIWPRLIKLAQEIKALGVNTVAINPNIHPDYPEDAPDEMAKKIKEWGIAFPYLVDATQEVAKAYDAQCTPDLYVFDANRKLFYHGRLDDNWKDARQVTREELKDAVLATVSGQMAPTQQHPSMGCSIKWK